MIFKKSPPSSPHTSGKIVISQSKETPDVSDADIQNVLVTAENIASSLESDTNQMSSWVSNAKLAIDLARKSLDEAGKLAEHVHKTAAETGYAVDTVEAGSTKVEAKIDQEIVDEGIKMVEAVEATAFPSRDKLVGQGELEKFQLRAIQVQALVDESRNQLNDVRNTVIGKTKLVTNGLQDQAAILSDTTAHALEQENAKQQEELCAQDLLKGKAPTEVSLEALDKIDGVDRESPTSVDV